MEIFDLAPILAIPAVTKIIDAYRQWVLERDTRKVLTTIGSWVVGAGAVALLTQSSVELPPWNWADIVFVGVGLGSTASIVHDFANRGDTKVVASGSSVTLEGIEPEPLDAPNLVE